MRPLVFDLDGTLIDSAPDIHAAVAATLEAEGHAPLPLPTVISFIGNGVPVLIARVIAASGLPSEDHPRLEAAFRARYEAAPTVLTRPYPGAVEALGALAAAGHPLAICTNKPEAPARAILAEFGIAGLFGAVVGGDSLPTRKPDPAMLHHAFAALGGPGIFIGDSEVDAETATRAGVPFGLFTEGYRKAPVAALPHAFAFAQFADLAGLLREELDMTPGG